MNNLMKIALVTLVVSFVDSAVLDRSRRDVQGDPGFKGVENQTYSSDINPKILNLSENLSSKSSYSGVITEDDLECDEVELTEPLASQTSIEKGKTPITENSNNGPLTNEEDDDAKATQNAHNSASIIISEILKGISKSTENITEEITDDSDEDENSNLEENEEEIQMFEQDSSNKKEGEEIGAGDEADGEITISGNDIENEEDDVEEEEPESTEDPQNLTSLLISQFMDNFFKSDRSQNASIDVGDEEEVATEDNLAVLETPGDEAASEKMTDGSAPLSSFDNLTKREIGFIDDEDEEIEESDRNTEDDFDKDNEEVTEEEVKETLLISTDEEEDYQ